MEGPSLITFALNLTGKRVIPRVERSKEGPSLINPALNLTGKRVIPRVERSKEGPSLINPRQHSVRVVDYSLPGGVILPARGNKLRLAHTRSIWTATSLPVPSFPWRPRLPQFACPQFPFQYSQFSLTKRPKANSEVDRDIHRNQKNLKSK
jgi:hypothetical protein